MTPVESISVIMPVWNGLPYIEEAIASVVNQSCSSWQLLVSDNGSTDGTRDYLRHLERKGDSRIKVFYQDHNVGIYGNLNFLVRNVKTKLIQIMAADDCFASNVALDEIFRFWATASPDILGVRWSGQNLRSDGVPEILGPEIAQSYFFLMGNLMGNISCVSFRKEAIVSVGWFDQSYPYAGDFEGWARMATKGSIVISSRQLVSIRAHAGQASGYLNLNGELYPQLMRISSGIFYRICVQNNFAMLVLKIAGTLVYDSQYRLAAIRASLAGNPGPLLSLNKAAAESPYVLPQVWRDLLFVFSLGGRLGKWCIISFCLSLMKAKKIVKAGEF